MNAYRAVTRNGSYSEKLMIKNATSLSISLVLATAVGGTTIPAHADVRTHADYVAIDVEGEENIGKDDRWVLTEPSTPAQSQDPDGNHSDTAVGNAYLELLPDIRVTHGDPFGPPRALWGAAGTGPEMDFLVDFPEAGRYYVHVRALSTGTEDNGIHVGLNGDWPEHGRSMQWCTGGRGWQWASRQRDSGGAGPCGVSHTIWLEVPTAGEHNVLFSAREDGFEFDRFMLIKDKSDNTRICEPNNENDISCRDGSLESFDSVVDMGIDIDADLSTVKEGEDVIFTLTAINEDSFDMAVNVEVDVAANIGSDWEIVSLNEFCQSAGTDINCVLGNIVPSNPEERDHSYSFTLRALTAGTSNLNAVISTTSIDGDPSNDTASTSVVIEDLIPRTTISAVLSGDMTSRSLNDNLTVSLELSNTGTETALAVNVDVVIPAGLSLDEQPANCTGTTTLACDFGDIAASESATLDLVMTTVEEGILSFSLAPSADNLSAELGVIQRSVLVVTPNFEEGEATGDAADDAADDNLGEETGGSGGGATAWLMLSSLGTLALLRRRYKPTIARRLTA